MQSKTDRLSNLSESEIKRLTEQFLENEIQIARLEYNKLRNSHRLIPKSHEPSDRQGKAFEYKPPKYEQRRVVEEEVKTEDKKKEVKKEIKREEPMKAEAKKKPVLGAWEGKREFNNFNIFYGLLDSFKKEVHFKNYS